MPKTQEKLSPIKQFAKGWQTVYLKKPGTFLERLGAGIAGAIQNTPKALNKLKEQNSKRNSTGERVNPLSLEVYDGNNTKENPGKNSKSRSKKR